MDLIYAPRHLCKRFGIDKIKAMTRGIPGGKQVIIFANTNNRGGICLFSQNEVTILVLQNAQDPVPERPISANPGLKFGSTFCIYFPTYCLE